MIREITDPFVEAKGEFVKWLLTQDYPSYGELLRQALHLVNPERTHGGIDPEKITMIDDGDYQGTLVFVIGAVGYQPYRYWYTRVSYGSCSGCDSIQAAWGFGDYCNFEGMYLIALHMLQEMREMTDQNPNENTEEP